MHASARDSHNRVQREYFDTVERPRLALGDTPYIRRHVAEVIRAGQFAPARPCSKSARGWASARCR
jgi:hypothetical protein